MTNTDLLPETISNLCAAYVTTHRAVPATMADFASSALTEAVANFTPDLDGYCDVRDAALDLAEDGQFCRDSIKDLLLGAEVFAACKALGFRIDGHLDIHYRSLAARKA
tara:strand:+ start:82 stop:408 length:327 start_codon:yes stop_codon:yes gene_type:complete